RRPRRRDLEEMWIRQVIDLVLERHDAAGQSEDEDEDGGDESTDQVQLEDDLSHASRPLNHFFRGENTSIRLPSGSRKCMARIPHPSWFFGASTNCTPADFRLAYNGSTSSTDRMT